MQSNSGVIVSSENKKRFSPFFVAMIGGKQEMVTLGNFLNDVPRYINSDISHMYENEKELRAKFAKQSNKAKNFVKLDMSKAKARGLAFDPKNRNAKKARDAEQAEHMAGLVKDVAEKRKRVEAAFLEKQRKAQAQAQAQAEAIEKAKAEARAEVLAEVEAQRKTAEGISKESKPTKRKTKAKAK